MPPFTDKYYATGKNPGPLGHGKGSSGNAESSSTAGGIHTFSSFLLLALLSLAVDSADSVLGSSAGGGTYSNLGKRLSACRPSMRVCSGGGKIGVRRAAYAMNMNQNTRKEIRVRVCVYVRTLGVLN